ncbi:hypothetical protein [Luteolibacter flavescens]|uniref:hypothetical protein n=1 Tax=Luteolibacter flavescens TaxID=1859460 RepID=UPI0022236C73|nr:hypothetical protein [Luteolibacter flavescens]
MTPNHATLWIPFADGRVARVRIDMHSAVLPTPLEVEAPVMPSRADVESVSLSLARGEAMASPPFEVGLQPAPPRRVEISVCPRCHGMGWVPSRTDTDTDPCPQCSLPPLGR